MGQNHNIIDILPKLKSVEELTCDEDLEEYICDNRSTLGLFPHLTLLNGVSTEITNMGMRQKYKQINALIAKLPAFADQYLVGEGALAHAVWYMQDEVGSAIQHSDKPNVNVHAFMYSPNNSAKDANAISFNVLWPTQDISVNECIYKDYLKGMTEQHFRSARLHTWFDTPDKYFADSLKQLRALDVTYDVEGEFNRI